MKFLRFAIAIAFVLPSLLSQAFDISGTPQAHAPISIMGDHTHHKGEFMLSYRYMYMNMKGLRSNSSNVSSSDALNQFMVTPTQMNMHMHMLGGMWAPSNRLTLMLMLPFLQYDMDHLTRMGATFSTQSQGIGDASLSFMFKIFEKQQRQLQFNMGLSLPTGSIDKRDDTPAMNNAILPYPMQLGAGTLVLKPSVVFHQLKEKSSTGIQVKAFIPTHENARSYTPGINYEVSHWYAHALCKWLSASLRTSYKQTFDHKGADPALNANMISTADPSLRASRIVNGYFGFNLKVPEKKYRLSAEFGLPLYQHIDGPSLENNYSLMLGFQY